MVKTIHIFLEDQEFKELKKKKGDLSWKDYLLNL